MSSDHNGEPEDDLGPMGVILTVIMMLEAVEASVYSGREDICSLEECECQLDTVICTCSQDSSFQVIILSVITDTHWSLTRRNSLKRRF